MKINGIIYNDESELSSNEKKRIYFDKKSHFYVVINSGNKVNFSCCDHVSDGCNIILNDYAVSVCHKHLIDIFGFVLEKIQVLENGQSLCIEIFNTNILISKICLLHIRKVISGYLYRLYKLHSQDDLFNDENLTELLKRQFYNFKLNEKREITDEINLSRLSEPEAEFYKKRKQLLFKMQDCVKHKKRLFYPLDSIQRNRSEVKFHTYSSIRGIGCKIKEHFQHKSASLIITTNRNDCFRFSFCLDCIFDLFKALQYMCFYDSKEEYRLGAFTIYHKPIDDYCYFTGIKEDRMYEIFFNNISVVLCEKSYIKLFESIIGSTLFSEVFNKAVKNAKMFLPEDIDIRHGFSAEEYEDIIKEKDNDIIRLQEYQQKLNKLINKQKEEISLLKRCIDEQSDELDVFKNQFKDTDSFISEINSKRIDEYEDKILDCQSFSPDGNYFHLGISKKEANRYPDAQFHVIYIDDYYSRTFYNTQKRELVAVIGTTRPNDKFCFSLGKRDAELLAGALKEVLATKRAYSRNSERLSVIIVPESKKQYCYMCRDEVSREYCFSFGNYRFTLCENCVELFYREIERVNKLFDLMQKTDYPSFVKSFL